MKMSRTIRLSAGMAGALVSCLLAPAAFAQNAAPATVTLTRLECGTGATRPVAAFNDSYAFEDLKVALTFSCYLIQHGNDYMVWDAGFGPGAPTSPKTSLVDMLAQLKVNADQVKYIGISHYHDDHIGQAGSFPKATLLIGKGDWDALSSTELRPGTTAEQSAKWRAPFASWISGGGKVDALTSDKKDVFGDGSVVMVSMPGHTPGHHSLLVKLAQTGNVLLTGDVTHFHENYDVDGVPTWNFNRADTLASLDRFKKIAKNLKATVIIQHDVRDINKLPAFPASAK